MTSHQPTPICAFHVNPHGEARSIDLPEGELAPQDGYRWLHLDLSDPQTSVWLHRNLSRTVAKTLTQTETRPRCDVVEDGLIFNLRGVNLNPGANPDDMVSVRLWITQGLIISTRIRKIWAVDTLRQGMENGKGPVAIANFLAELAYGLTKRIEAVSLELVERTDEVEENYLSPSKSMASELAVLRQSVIKLRRFVRPQNEALAELAGGQVWPLDADCANLLRDTTNRTTRIVEELDATSDRLQALQDHTDMLHAASLGRNSYVLSVIAAIFLPLGFLTGLFGINVGGMPGVESALGFWFVAVGSAILGVVLFLVFRYLKWL